MYTDIPGYEGIYKINEKGEIKSSYSGEWKILKPCGKKYPMVDLRKDGGRKMVCVHSLMALTFMGPSLGRDVMHLDGNKGNPHKDNLRYGSKSCNEAFKTDHGTRVFPTAKLNPAQVLRIKEYTIVGIPGKELAKCFGVSMATISGIKTGRIWPDVLAHSTRDT